LENVLSAVGRRFWSASLRAFSNDGLGFLTGVPFQKKATDGLNERFHGFPGLSFGLVTGCSTDTRKEPVKIGNGNQ